jgi:ERCC4-related helicase
MAGPVDLSPLHRELDALRRQLCHCDHAGTCLGCQGVEMLRQQAQMVVSAATQPVLLQVAQEAQARELMEQIRQLQEQLMKDPDAMRALEDLMRHFQPPPPPDDH